MNHYVDKRLIGLKERALSLPTSSGCYLMKNKKNDIIYIGKAKNLKARVKSYFDQSQVSAKTKILVSHIQDFDFILTKSDAESYILENNLIKKYSPKYNIRLRDDKTYPYIQVDYREAFPRLDYTRKPSKAKEVQLYGPFPSGSNISEVLRVLTKAFKLRDCSLHEFKNRTRACLLYQIHQCSAPCVGSVSEQKYRESLRLACHFLEGGEQAKEALQVLAEAMHRYSNDESYERAAMLRDQVRVLESFLEQASLQSVEFHGEHKSIDVINYYVGDEQVDISFYLIRNGLLLGQKNYHFYKSELIENLEQELLSAIVGFYADSFDRFPQKMITPFGKENKKLQAVLEELSAKKVHCYGGAKKYKKLLELTKNHAEQSQKVRLSNQESPFVGLEKLKALLSLEQTPRLLECYDIAIWQGKSPTAAKIVFLDGKPDKSSYRHYHLQERKEGNNDFAMMAEVLKRRLSRGELPDVFVVDGGKAQVNTFQRVLAQNDVDIPVVGIAKSRVEYSGTAAKAKKRSEERLIIANRANPFFLSRCMPLYRIIVQMRDEAHRFSRRLHHHAEKKRVFHSWVEQIPGIGSKTKKKILQRLDLPLNTLKSMSSLEIAEYFGISEIMANSIQQYLSDFS